jgi:predicted nuclease of predicted toxin-antitoxin system
MRLLAHENVPGDAVAALRQAGHDVVWVRTDAPGSSDREILNWAQTENRIVVTFDKDFGELAFRFGLPASNGIVLLRLAPIDWAGHFVVVEQDRLRIRPLPK